MIDFKKIEERVDWLTENETAEDIEKGLNKIERQYRLREGCDKWGKKR